MTPRYALASYRAWIDHVTDYKAYLNTTLRSPMPRSRTEAMIGGVIPVTLDNHDAGHFIRNGVNGFLGETSEELAEALRFIMRNDTAREAISAEARRTALQIFNHDRYLSDWEVLLHEVGV